MIISNTAAVFQQHINSGFLLTPGQTHTQCAVHSQYSFNVLSLIRLFLIIINTIITTATNNND